MLREYLKYISYALYKAIFVNIFAHVLGTQFKTNNKPERQQNKVFQLRWTKNGEKSDTMLVLPMSGDVKCSRQHKDQAKQRAASRKKGRLPNVPSAYTSFDGIPPCVKLASIMIPSGISASTYGLNNLQTTHSSQLIL